MYRLSNRVPQLITLASRRRTPRDIAQAIVDEVFTNGHRFIQHIVYEGTPESGPFSYQILGFRSGRFFVELLQDGTMWVYIRNTKEWWHHRFVFRIERSSETFSKIETALLREVDVSLNREGLFALLAELRDYTFVNEEAQAVLNSMAAAFARHDRIYVW